MSRPERTLPTPLPWRINELGETDLFIEGPEGSAATEELPKDRRVVCVFPTSGGAEDLELARVNAHFILEAVNEGGSR